MAYHPDREKFVQNCQSLLAKIAEQMVRVLRGHGRPFSMCDDIIKLARRIEEWEEAAPRQGLMDHEIRSALEWRVEFGKPGWEFDGVLDSSLALLACRLGGDSFGHQLRAEQQLTPCVRSDRSR